GNSLIYSTYLGGGNCDCGFGIAVDGSGNAYVTGETWSSDFPTENPYQGSFQGGYTDVFVTKIGDFVDAADDDETEDLVPDGFSLYQNYPNPFNPSTVVEYSLKRSANVSFEVYNVLGQKVRHYDLGRQMYGSHRLTWDGYDNNGKLVSSGVYFYRLKAGDYTETKKMLLLR
ncbi:MAG: T9SS type A sorting domain-containing protein, partial [candidate division Zixibacteria bacterium]|nr:T9SS type A sorting domain-containing protein [candidate division Zixibacteria bacterium]